MQKMLVYLFAFNLLLYCYIPAGQAQPPLSVFVSIPPQKQFVQQIGKDLVQVHVMVEPGADPHTYEPKPRQMAAIANADLYFAVGVEFEDAKLKKIVSTNPKLTVVHTDSGIEKRPFFSAHHHAHEAGDHKKGHHHDEGLADPHIWLSPSLVMIQAGTIASALKKADPANRAVYEKNCDAFLAKVAGLDKELKQLFLGKRGLRFMVFHPSWGYFAHDYGLIQIPIELEGKSPKPSQLQELIKEAQKNQVRMIFAQPQISRKSAELIAREIDGEVILIDPLAENWFDNMRMVANKFQAALHP